MTIDTVRQTFPNSAKDTKINLSKVLSEDGAPDLTPTQQFGVALASAYAVQNAALVDAVLVDAADILSEQDIEAAKSAASIMAMNNIYYRFVHLVSDNDYSQMPSQFAYAGDCKTRCREGGFRALFAPLFQPLMDVVCAWMRMWQK